MDINKDQFFAWFDEWAETRGLIDNAQTAGIGEAYDFAAYVRGLYGTREVGQAMAALLSEAPTRLLYPHEGNSEREIEVLAYMKAAIEADPKWFINRLGGSSIARMAETEDGPVKGLIVVPPVNLIYELPREAAIVECQEWLKNKANLAIGADLSPQTTGGFVGGSGLTRV